MSPLATIDLVGLDIHKAIIENLYQYTDDQLHHCFILPDYINVMVDKRCLGNKTPNKGGFYKKDANGNRFVLDLATFDYLPERKPQIEFIETAKYMVRLGMYREAFDIIKTTPCKEANIVLDTLCTYVTYSYSRIGEVVSYESGIDSIDKVMSFGYNWAAPSMIVDMLGGRDAFIELLEQMEFEIPGFVERISESACEFSNAGKYFLAR